MNQDLLKSDSVKKNYLFQFLYQVVTLVLPLVVSPYLTRILGGTALGTYTYTFSVAYYFVMFAMLGINQHGQRVISQRRNDLSKLRLTFWSLCFVHFLASIVSIIAYVCYTLFLFKSDQTVVWIQTIYVASSIFDFTWLFYGLEKFKIVTIRNMIIKLINAFCIFMFVKSRNDINTYTLIMTATSCAGHIVMIPQVISSIPPIRFKWNDIREHFRPLFTLFAAALAASLYTIFDKTLLGILATKKDVAFYEYSDKIINIPKTFISICGTVMFPTACRFAANHDFLGLNRVLRKAITIAFCIGFGSCFGLLAIADQFAVLYYGDEFSVCGGIIQMMSPLILIVGIGDALRAIYIYPLKMDIQIVKILFINAGINLLLSSVLIPILGVEGAIIGTFSAEVFGFTAEFCLVRKYVQISQAVKTCLAFTIIGLIMFAFVKFIGTHLTMSWISMLIQIIAGALIYGACAVVYFYFFDKDTFENVRRLLTSLLVKLHIKRDK